MKYTRGIAENVEIWDRTAEFQIDKIAAQEVLEMQLEEDDISEALGS